MRTAPSGGTRLGEGRRDRGKGDRPREERRRRKTSSLACVQPSCSLAAIMSYSRLPEDELEADLQGGNVPPDVLAAAHNLYATEFGRRADSDEVAMAFVQKIVLEKRRAASLQQSASSATGVPANVLAAANNLFLAHHGRHAGSIAEAMSFAHQLAQDDGGRSGGRSGGSSGGSSSRGMDRTSSVNDSSSNATIDAAASIGTRSDSADTEEEGDLLAVTVPPHVAAAAFSIFEWHMGRPAANTAEALEVASRVVAAAQGVQVDDDAPPNGSATKADDSCGCLSHGNDVAAPPAARRSEASSWQDVLVQQQRRQPATHTIRQSRIGVLEPVSTGAKDDDDDDEDEEEERDGGGVSRPLVSGAVSRGAAASVAADGLEDGGTGGGGSSCCFMMLRRFETGVEKGTRRLRTLGWDLLKMVTP